MSLHDSEVEARDPAEQRVRDDAALRDQLAYLRERSPFYRDKLAGTAVGGLDDLPALPFTIKEELRASIAAEPPLGRHLAAPLEAVRRIFSTSGTTGDPLYIAVTDADLAGWTEIGARSYRACGIAPGQRAVLTYNSGPFVAGAVLDAWSRIGATVIPVGSGNTERLVKAFQVLGADGARLHALLRDLPRRLVPRARHRPGSLGDPPHRRRGRARRRRARDARADRGVVRRDRARGDGHRRRLAVAVGRVRGAGRHALLRPRLRPRRADRPGQRRAAAVGGRRRGRARLHLAAPRGDAGRCASAAATACSSRRGRARAGARASACAASAAPTTS